MLSSKRARWIITTIADCLKISDSQVEDQLAYDNNSQMLSDFFSENGPKKILVYYQVLDVQSDEIKDVGAEPSIFITNGDKEKLKDKAIYFVKNFPVSKDKTSQKVNLQEASDNDIIFGEISPKCLVQLDKMMSTTYHPMFHSMGPPEWGQCESEIKDEFLSFVSKFSSEVSDSIQSMAPGQELFQLDADDHARLNQQGQDQDKVHYFERKFSQWLQIISNLLNDDSETKKEPADAGPKVELDYWRVRMQKITNWCEQLKNKDFQTVKNLLFRQQQHDVSQRGYGEEISKLIMDYNRLDLLLTDKLNEAKDNVKYLTTLEKFVEPLYNGSPQQIIDTLPALMNAIKMIHTIARFFNTTDKMTGLFMKITNQMITNCKKRILDGHKSSDVIWGRDPAELIEVLSSCIKLNKEYKDCYKETKEKVVDMPKGKTFDFSETQIFGKFDLFCRRVLKLIDIFNTIQQFQSLAKHNLEGMDKLTEHFKQIIDDFKKKRHELLDYQNNKFDRDYVEFNVQISHLDIELQNFIDNNFNRFKNIEYSLKLLHKFESTLKRDSLKHKLTTKYNAILNNYATELDGIQRIFTDQKTNPPIVRNMPPDAGKIIWARHLFQKITGPINMFPENVINSNEIKRYYGSYNTLGKQLTIYEMWYYQSWCNEIEKSKAALQATLIVRHEENKKLYVNFDLEIMQLIREAKCMDRVGIEIPESARIILLQEDKFKAYYYELLFVLKEYERIIGKVKPIMKTLLGPHIDDLELKLRPGMVTLTWTSMNIDSYLEHVHNGLRRLEQLIINVNDVIENRIESNLKQVSKVTLVSLPENESKPFTLDQFVLLQEEFIKGRTQYLVSKNVEVEHAVDDLLYTILKYPLDPHVEPVFQEETKRIKRYYFWYLYQALLSATQNSLNAMKHRVCGTRDGGGLAASPKPFFEIYLQLDLKKVKLNPSQEEIQASINKAATAVLRCSKELFNWEQSETDNDKKASFYEMIAQDKEIVKVILLLTGSIQGTKNKVNELLTGFKKFEWLWMNNVQDSINKFTKKKPTLQDYEDQLKKFSAFEDEIDKIQHSHLIGAIELKTENLCQGLKSLAKDWKNQYAYDLHKRARNMLDTLTEQTKTLGTKLHKDVKDIYSLGYVMESLEDIRRQQAEIDMKFNPVLDMYQLLDSYLPGGIIDKDELDSRLMLKSNWDNLMTYSEVKQKELQQKQSFHLKDLKSDIKKFINEVTDFRKDYEANGPMVENISPKEAMERLRRFEDEYSVKHRQFQINKTGEVLFGLQNQKYPELEQTEAELKNLKKLYSLYAEVIESISKWKEKAWSDITVHEFTEIEDQIGKYGDQCIRLPKDLKEWNAYKELKTEIDNLKEVLPIIMDLKKPSIKARHWQKVIEISGVSLNYENEDNFYMSDLIEAGLLRFSEDIVDITDSADKQLKIEHILEEIKTFWETAIFEFSTWGKGRDYPCILNGMCVATITERLDEDQMTLAALNAQRHVLPFKPQVESQIRVFSEVSETLDMWIKVQMAWTSLETVFTGGDIARQMPVEAKKFQGIDKNWLKIMEKAVETKKVIPCCQNDMLKDFLPELQKNLDVCQKSLEQYLEKKRKKFPRFYFVSNQTLLKILSQGSEPQSIQEDFEKLFDAINKVTFDKNPEKKGSNEKIIKAITQVMGTDEETVSLVQYQKCEGTIEGWLRSLQDKMQDTIKEIIKTACGQCANMNVAAMKDFIKSYTPQIALIGVQFIWTQKLTEGLERTSKNEKGAMESKRREIQQMMELFTSMCLEDLSSCIERQKIETIVTVHVHQRDLAVELKCKDVSDFDWQKQTRIYWKQEIDNCIISITDWDCVYSHEFLGAKERLCITALTDRCYITLAQALSMFYGGAPAGPAGTGKTETVKDLGRTLGIFVVVTNCGDQHRSKDMAKIFKGLVQSGLWGCFDEFNRIDLEVLSVVAGQVESITAAKKQNVKEFWFPEETIQIDIVHTTGYFITMNPGYAGRQELPENLKVLFRGVTMMVPDRETIMKVKLASVGYNAIDILGKKFNILYALCEQQLSKQKHYDFGLRNILSVLRNAGNNKRQESKADEEMLLMRSLRDMNLSKFIADDIPLFLSLLADIFPKLTNVPKKFYPDQETQIKLSIEKKGYQNWDGWFMKIIQLYETFCVRHGFMLVGPTGCGKTAIMQVLTNALTELGTQYKINILNPKAITPEQLYGVKSEISDDWTPGIFSTLWQKSNNRANKYSTWIVCDGPVDAIWIENLNTVLDDNKILTLANGERIPMTENCKLVFEVENLNNASPATVSRCGIVYVSASDLGYDPIIKSWVQSRKVDLNRGEEFEKLNNIFQKYILTMRLFESAQKAIKVNVMDISDIIRITQFLNLLTGLIQPLVNQNKYATDEDYEKYFVFSMVWAVGGLLETTDRQLFHEHLVQKNLPIPSKGAQNETIFDYYLDLSKGGVDWKLCSPDEWKPPTAFYFAQTLIPTLDSYKANILLDSILNQPKSNICNKAVMLVGVSGTAKTSGILMYSERFNREVMLFKRMNFSSATKPLTFQTNVEIECDFKMGKDFAPPQGKNMTLFIDDINMPQVNKWGDQETLEIVRQLIENGGFYWLDKSMRGNFKNIKNLAYIGAMQHPGGGKNDVPNRIKRQFFIFNMVLPSSVELIYGPILKHIFKPAKFSAEFNKVVDSLTSGTVKLWNKVKNTLLPTPAKFHYVFNMRELSRIFKGITGVRRDIVLSGSTLGFKPEIFLIALWRHECERVFVDKLTMNKEKEQVKNYIHEISLENFTQFESEILDKFKKENPIHFVDFLREDVKDEDGLVEVQAEQVYEGIQNAEKLQARCYQLLDDYNAKYTSKKMGLVLFDDALAHLIRISRIIKQPRSSALLVGVGGSGKQSLTRLAAEIGRHHLRQLVLTKSFGEKDLKEEIKEYFEMTGHQGKPITFIMTDAEIKKEEFLEYINMMLSTGEIPGLVAKDEKEAWLGDLTQEYSKEKGIAEPSATQLWAYFVDRVRDNLHIVLAFSPVGSKFRERARKFPALFNECSIDWFLPWPEEALVSVAETFIKNFKELDTKPETKIELYKHMGSVHQMVTSVCDIYLAKMRRQVFVTPKSYLSYLNAYKLLYVKKYYSELDIQERNFKIGLEKIAEASISIAKMEVSLKEEESKLKEASDKTDILIADIEKESKKAKTKNDQVEKTTAECVQQAEQISKDKAEAEKDLQMAMPALARAQVAVTSLNSKDIVELKANRNPAVIIKFILDTVTVFFQGKLLPIIVVQVEVNKKEGRVIPFLQDSYDEGGKAVLSDMNFMKNLMAFEKDAISEETMEILFPYMSQKSDWFTEQAGQQVSKAAAGIMAWSFAIYEYHEKSKIVKPKQAFLKVQEGKLKVANAELEKSQAELTQIKIYMAELNEKFRKQMAEKQLLEDQAAKTKKKINTARQLISSLTDERDRWAKFASEIGEAKRRLVGNCSLATAFISYCGPFNSEFRVLLQNEYFIGDMKKKGVPVTPTLELTSFLVDDATVGEWNIQGLPKDDLSVQNGIMVTNSSRYPLLIDPQGQGQNWIQNKYSESIEPSRCITTLQHPKFKDYFLKFCLEEGKTLVIEGIENEVDPMLDPVLEKQIQARGKNKFIDVGGSQFDFSPDFNMFLTCRLPNPLFSPELSAKTAIIDFTVTQGGLEQQLLGRVLSKEQKSLEESLNNLLADVNFNKKDLQRLEKNLLERLTQSKGNLLDDTELMDVLNLTKTQSKDVAIKLADAEVKTKEINEKREQYRPVAIRGSALYFCIIDMSMISWMYNSSLEQYLKYFDESIDQSEKEQQPSKRVEKIIKYLTFHVYKNINRGLFERDKVTYILMICFKIMTTAEKITNSDVNIFLKGGASLDIKSERSRPFNFITDKVWLNILSLSRHHFGSDPLAFFRDLPDSIQRNEAQWKQWIDKNDPENYPIPDFQERILAEKEIGSLLQVSLVRCMREDRTLVSSSNFILQILGKEFTSPISYPIDSVWQSSSTLEPLLYLLSAGSDPTSTIEELARKKKKYPLKAVSMGEGQDVKAMAVMQEQFVSGGWVVLQNCHLGLKFMQQLLSILEPGQYQIHDEFRLWITTEPNKLFPLGLLQTSLKVTNEPPKGLKAGIYKTFTTLITQDFLDKIEHPSWRSLTFTLCFLHSVVIERRKFGPLGWCVPYEFNNSDLEASMAYVEKYLTNLMQGPATNMQALSINTNVIKYMACEVQYGGKITDNLDRELFNAYGDDYIKEGIFGNEHTFIEIIQEGSGTATKERFKYKIPANPNNEINKYREYIDIIPPVDNPEVFGLHPNADLTFRMKESLEMIITLQETRPKDAGGGGGVSKDEMVQEKARELKSKLPPDYNLTEVREIIKKIAGPKGLADKGLTVPLNVFLFQEIIRFQQILGLVRTTLSNIVEAIDGNIIMTPDIMDAIDKIFDAEAPHSWIYDASGAEISWILPALGAWITSLMERYNQLNNWFRTNRPNTFWLTGFFNPQGFLTAMKQEVTRMHKGGGKDKESWSLDDVVYHSMVKDKEYEMIKDIQSEGVYIHGLYLEGARFAKAGLDDPEPKKLFAPLPILYVTAINKKKSPDGERMSSTYSCPVYKYPKRTDRYIIFRVGLPCEGSGPQRWKLRGVALLCSTD